MTDIHLGKCLNCLFLAVRLLINLLGPGMAIGSKAYLSLLIKVRKRRIKGKETDLVRVQVIA